MKRLVILALSASLAACTWVKPTPEGEKVRLLSKIEVQNCDYKGDATVSLMSKVGPVKRKTEKVKKELQVLARNNAAQMGGDTIVVMSDIVKGEQTFGVYRCVK